VAQVVLAAGGGHRRAVESHWRGVLALKAEVEAGHDALAAIEVCVVGEIDGVQSRST